MDALIIRNMRDFQLLFNQMSESCFKTCVNTFLSRDVSTDEAECIEKCSGKQINANHKIMEIFLEVQPVIARKHMEEIKAQAAVEAAENEQNPQNAT